MSPVMPDADDVVTITPSPNFTETIAKGDAGKHSVTLGTVRLRDQHTNQIILIPTPSNNPDDPLNWSQAYKYYITALVCLALLVVNAAAAGHTIDIVGTAVDFFPNRDLLFAITSVAYFFSSTALAQGVSNFIWVPLGSKYGRRPVYLLSYSLFLAFTIWIVFEHRYASFLVARILLGIASGAAECLAPLTIADIFFLHERGTIVALYTCCLSAGVSLGIVITGLVLRQHEWRDLYKGLAVIIALILVLAFLTFPETAYLRDHDETTMDVHTNGRGNHSRRSSVTVTDFSPPAAEKATSYLNSLKLFRRRTLTRESLMKMFLRPLGLIILPPVLWAALVQSVTIGFLVAVTSNIPRAFLDTYEFESYQTGLTYIAGVVGSLIGIPAGGKLGDMVADWLTKRNDGVRHPEMRLPAISLSLVTAPLGLILYGAGIQKRLHWICPTIGNGLLSFSITQATNICLVYVIDAYRPVAGEITVTVLGFKSVFGFVLSFYTNSWVEEAGYLNAFGSMAAIAALVLLFWIPLYVWGRTLRHGTWKWWLISHIHWEHDRDVGE